MSNPSQKESRQGHEAQWLRWVVLGCLMLLWLALVPPNLPEPQILLVRANNTGIKISVLNLPTLPLLPLIPSPTPFRSLISTVQIQSSVTARKSSAVRGPRTLARSSSSNSSARARRRPGNQSSNRRNQYMAYSSIGVGCRTCDTARTNSSQLDTTACRRFHPSANNR